MLVTLYDKTNQPFEVNPTIAVKLLRTGDWSKVPRPAQEPVAPLAVPYVRREPHFRKAPRKPTRRES